MNEDQMKPEIDGDGESQIHIHIDAWVPGKLGPGDLGPRAYIAILSLQSGDLGPRAQWAYIA